MKDKTILPFVRRCLRACVPAWLFAFAICNLQFAICNAQTPAAATSNAPATQPAPTQPAVLRLPVYNATPHAVPGSLPVHFVYDQELYPGTADRTQMFDLAHARQVAQDWPKGVLTLIDHEAGDIAPQSYTTSDAPQCRAYVRQLGQIRTFLRQCRPDLTIDLWGGTVCDDYGFNEADPNLIQRQLNDIANTEALRPLSNGAVYTVVAAYRFAGQDDAAYRNHAIRLIYRARIPGKPVLITICPNNADPNTFAADAKALAHYADGLIVWDYDPTNAREAWVGPLVAALAR